MELSRTTGEGSLGSMGRRKWDLRSSGGGRCTSWRQEGFALIEGLKNRRCIYVMREWVLNVLNLRCVETQIGETKATRFQGQFIYGSMVY